MKRDVNKLMELYQGEHGHPTPKSDKPEDIYGHDGEYFTGDFNKRWAERARLMKKGLCQHGLWCQWEISEDGKLLQWDGGEKFYNYVEWLKYLINHFFEPWGIKLNGTIEWEGEDHSDTGRIIVTDNVVKTQVGVTTYKDVDDED